MFDTKQLKIAKQKLFELRQEAKNMVAAAEVQGRDLSATEGSRLDSIEDEAARCQNKIDAGTSELNAEMKRTLPGGGYIPGTGAFKNFGEQLSAVVEAGIPGGMVDARLHEIKAASGLNNATPSEGGFLVQQDFGKDILGHIFDNDEILKRITRYPISANANGIKIPAVNETSRADGSRAGGVRGFWISEGGEKTASKPSFRQISLELKKMVVLVYSTDELLQDSTALGKFIIDAARREINFKLTDSVINGIGAGQPLGILNSGALVTVAVESGQTSAAPLLAENVFKMYARHLVTDPSRCCWLVNRNVLPAMYNMTVTAGTGGLPVYLPANGLSGSPYNTLLGLPVFISEHCAPVATTGDIILADLSNYIGIDKGGIEEAVSIHVRFVFDESVFRFVMRFDGMPAAQAPITPFKGSETISPFIALATRS